MSQLYPDLTRTQFPQNTDTFPNYLDLSTNDGALVQQYHEAIAANNPTLAQSILASIPNVNQKIVKANDLNAMTEAILAVERFMNGDYEQFVNDRQDEWEEQIENFKFMGTWSSGTTYAYRNVVEYTIDGLNLLYIATTNPPVGSLPTNTLYWRLLTIRGLQGESGEGWAYRNTWSASETYAVQDAVSYSSKLWGAIQPSLNQTPNENSAYWRVIMDLGTTIYPVQSTQPTGQNQGELWFKEVGTIQSADIVYS